MKVAEIIKARTPEWKELEEDIASFRSDGPRKNGFRRSIRQTVPGDLW